MKLGPDVYLVPIVNYIKLYTRGNKTGACLCGAPNSALLGATHKYYTSLAKYAKDKHSSLP
jgi:hypothetical protein